MPFYNVIMTTTLTLDKAGRVVIPKPLRDELQLGAGDSLALESQGDQITLRPVRGSAALRKEDGIWVFRTGKRIPQELTDKILDDLRSERDTDHTGKSR